MHAHNWRHNLSSPLQAKLSNVLIIVLYLSALTNVHESFTYHCFPFSSVKNGARFSVDRTWDCFSSIDVDIQWLRSVDFLYLDYPYWSRVVEPSKQLTAEPSGTEGRKVSPLPEKSRRFFSVKPHVWSETQQFQTEKLKPKFASSPDKIHHS